MAGITKSVAINSNWGEDEMACSVVNAKKNTIDHYPKSTDTCFTWRAWAGCRYSNLAYGGGAPQNSADTVLQYLDDSGVSSLGHRRWVLHPGITHTAFGGVKSSNSYYSAMVSINGTSMSGYPEVPFIAWPPPGPVHYQLFYSNWHFEAKGLTSNAKVTVKYDGKTKSPSVTFDNSAPYNFRPMIKYSVDTAANLKGKTIEVTVTDGSNTYKYTTTSVDCGAYVKPDGKLRDGSKISDDGSGGSSGSSETSGSSGSSSGKSNSSVQAAKIIPWIVLGVFVIAVIVIAIFLFRKAKCVVVASHVEERRETRMVLV